MDVTLAVSWLDWDPDHTKYLVLVLQLFHFLRWYSIPDCLTAYCLLNHVLLQSLTIRQIYY